MEATEPTALRLYSPQQICFAAFIGSPVAACWCFAHNFRQLGQSNVALKWLIWGCGGSFIALLTLCLIPFAQQIPHYIIPIVYSLAFREVAKRIHGEVVAQRISAGGRLASWWFVVGTSLLFLIGVLGAILAILYPVL